MVLLPPDATDIVPDISLATEIALLDTRMVLACRHHRNHVEMMHVVAWRFLVALLAFGRTGRRMLEAGNPPVRGDVAGRTFLSEQVAMRTPFAVPTKAIELFRIGRRFVQLA
jgi:hypothetical protein